MKRSELQQKALEFCRANYTYPSEEHDEKFGALLRFIETLPPDREGCKRHMTFDCGCQDCIKIEEWFKKGCPVG